MIPHANKHIPVQAQCNKHPPHTPHTLSDSAVSVAYVTNNTPRFTHNCLLLRLLYGSLFKAMTGINDAPMSDKSLCRCGCCLCGCCLCVYLGHACILVCMCVSLHVLVCILTCHQVTRQHTHPHPTLHTPATHIYLRASAIKSLLVDTHTALCLPHRHCSNNSPAMVRPFPTPAPSPRKKPPRAAPAPFPSICSNRWQAYTMASVCTMLSLPAAMTSLMLSL